MSGMSDYSAQNWLNYITGKVAMPATPTAYLALLTTAPTADNGTGAVEVSGAGYARLATAAADWNAASGSAPSSISNSATKSFAAATADWGTVVAVALYDAASAGNLLTWDYLGNFSWQPCTISSAAPGVFTAKGHGFANGDNVVFSTEFGGTAPTFSQSNLTGLLTVANATADTFTVTNGGTAVNTSSTGSGMVRKVVTQSVPSGVTASFAGGTPGAIVLTAA